MAASILHQEARRFSRHLRDDMISEGELALCAAGYPEAGALQRIIVRRAMIDFQRKETKNGPLLEDYDEATEAGQEACLILREEVAADVPAREFRRRYDRQGLTGYKAARVLRWIALGNLP